EGKCECGEVDPNYVPPHVHEFIEGKCECGEVDPNYVPPHVHEFIEGKCECGEVDPNYVPPHVHEFVEGKCECGEVDPNYVAQEEEHVETFDSTLATHNMEELIQESVTVEEAHNALADEQLGELVDVQAQHPKYKAAKKEKHIINIDVVSMNYQNGETVDLESLKAKNLLPKKCNYFKVLARGVLNKSLTFVANDFSNDAIKMILLTGGKVVLIEE
ncbi:MAG: uL15 family ribosomal protein, partial [Bacilli bacterium]|nr:uL15 family ribosomal protein [Bacilli bacterium]